MSEETAIVSASNVLTQPAGSLYCSIKAQPGDRKAASTIYNAMNNPKHRVSDMINKDILIENFLIEMTEIANEETGEVACVPRCVLIDDKGESYQAVSVGIGNALVKLVMVCGQAPWVPPVKVQVRQQQTKRGSMLTLEMVG